MTFPFWRKCALASALCIAVPAATWAQGTAPIKVQHLISIKPGSLTDMHNQLSERTGKPIVFDSGAFARIESGGVHGQVAFAEAPGQALAGRGLQLRDMLLGRT